MTSTHPALRQAVKLMTADSMSVSPFMHASWVQQLGRLHVSRCAKLWVR